MTRGNDLWDSLVRTGIRENFLKFSIVVAHCILGEKMETRNKKFQQQNEVTGGIYCIRFATYVHQIYLLFKYVVQTSSALVRLISTFSSVDNDTCPLCNEPKFSYCWILLNRPSVVTANNTSKPFGLISRKRWKFGWLLAAATGLIDD